MLITSDKGDVLIDGALPESAAGIEASVQALGFRMQDIKLILNSHVHYDHAGGLADLQKASGAKVFASNWSAGVLKTGRAERSDPQYGILPSIKPLMRVKTLRDGQTIHLGGLALTAHSTPGHTPGGTSWTWQSCEKGRCRNIVYADSVSPVSAEGFKFTHSDTYPNAIQGFEKSFAFLTTTPCDILITPHPEASDFWERVAGHKNGVTPDPLEDSSQCRKLAASARLVLDQRIHAEIGH